MFKNFFINRLNEKYAGKELWFCNRVYEDILFYPDRVCKCCHCTKMPYSPPVIYDKPIKIFSLLEYIKKIEEYMSLNQTENAPCRGCKYFRRQVVPEFPQSNFIKFFTINHFTKCNSDCVYCILEKKSDEDISYNLLPILKQMVELNAIHDTCLFNWGGGEPTICREFEEIAEFLHSHYLRQAINSSGIVFSNTVLKGLKDGSMSIQISPDAGTEETYYKIKRQNNFETVWGNIKKYALYPDMLYVKYIFFSLSANENDVRMFMERCIDAGVKIVVIDCESSSANNPESPFGNITQEMLKLAVLMKHIAIDNGMKYELSYQWREEHRQYIESN